MHVQYIHLSLLRCYLFLFIYVFLVFIYEGIQELFSVDMIYYIYCTHWSLWYMHVGALICLHWFIRFLFLP
jgi:hypothetical protein